jgi:hypothetical protein
MITAFVAGPQVLESSPVIFFFVPFDEVNKKKRRPNAGCSGSLLLVASSGTLQSFSKF